MKINKTYRSLLDKSINSMLSAIEIYNNSRFDKTNFVSNYTLGLNYTSLSTNNDSVFTISPVPILLSHNSYLENANIGLLYYLNLWRVPTDNDKGGNPIHQSLESMWKNIGFDDMYVESFYEKEKTS